MDQVSSELGLVGGPLILLVLGYNRASHLGAGHRGWLIGAAGLALAINIALGLVTAVLYVPAFSVFDDGVLLFSAGPLFVAPVSVGAACLVALVVRVLLPASLKGEVRLLAWPDGDSLVFLALMTALIGLGLALTAPGEPPIPLQPHVTLSLFTYGLIWPLLLRGLEADPDSAATPWWTIGLAAAFALNPLVEIAQAIRSGGETFTNATAAYLVTQGAFLVSLGLVRARTRSVPAVLLAAIGGQLAAIAISEQL